MKANTGQTDYVFWNAAKAVGAGVLPFGGGGADSATAPHATAEAAAGGESASVASAVVVGLEAGARAPRGKASSRDAVRGAVHATEDSDSQATRLSASLSALERRAGARVAGDSAAPLLLLGDRQYGHLAGGAVAAAAAGAVAGLTAGSRVGSGGGGRVVVRESAPHTRVAPSMGSGGSVRERVAMIFGEDD